MKQRGWKGSACRPTPTRGSSACQPRPWTSCTHPRDILGLRSNRTTLNGCAASSAVSRWLPQPNPIHIRVQYCPRYSWWFR